ncbi:MULTISPECIES: carbohydrate ABC transporter permease [unclassified Janthinobacterium]|uniref:carbohydrate ABC transporter permease n=1 Tax=unclassified Janthinobacterium TaxID=2610881 RepID=UPI001621E6EC|nr:MULTISPECIES: sugar ABC transporter permease [unclassified Janthinobacterium]MBB5368614.1 glucose/mannose transport system permease protein [Janthinobacterium sp. K2C7]MBB5381850.1 glucose/mannose transport system permease protein [Janthinobacterium sp. K2Li3]MBB5386996.1 glucose/mannose transport system permease protein [Janthinobacterium sp. K2E3]
MSHVNKPAKRRRFSLAANIALLPMALTVLFAYVGTMLWTLRVSVSSSRTFPADDFVGAAQYVRLFNNERWLLSLHNLLIYGVLFIAACLVLGFLLAVFIDQKVAAEGVLRTIFLYPYAMSFVATGLVWQWMLNPELGIQEVLHKLGFEHARFDWIIDQDMAIYTVVIATVWQASGLVMALMLSGLRGIDEEMWKAARIDGIPRWRVYVSIVLPMLGPSISTAFVLLFVMVVKVYDAVVAMTQGGPGTASEVPAKFIMDYLFGRANIGLASAASVVLLTTVLAIVVPIYFVRNRASKGKVAR